MAARNMPQFFSIAEFAKRLGISSKTVKRRIDEGKLRCHRFEGVIRISEEDAVAYVAQHRW